MMATFLSFASNVFVFLSHLIGFPPKPNPASSSCSSSSFLSESEFSSESDSNPSTSSCLRFLLISARLTFLLSLKSAVMMYLSIEAFLSTMLTTAPYSKLRVSSIVNQRIRLRGLMHKASTSKLRVNQRIGLRGLMHIASTSGWAFWMTFTSAQPKSSLSPNAVMMVPLFLKIAWLNTS